jgi:hypothetical protein
VQQHCTPVENDLTPNSDQTVLATRPVTICDSTAVIDLHVLDMNLVMAFDDFGPLVDINGAFSVEFDSIYQSPNVRATK